MYPQQPIRLAVANLTLQPHDHWQSWCDTLDRQVAKAVGEGAELLVLPAWGTLGLAPTGGSAERYASLSALLDNFIEHLRELARSHLRYIVAPGLPVSLSQGRYRHRVHLFAPNGALAFQDQLLISHTHSAEGVDAGEQLKCFDTELGRLAILVGADIQHPALTQACSEAGAWLLLNPTCDADPAEAVINANAAPVRAQESGCFVAQAVCRGNLAGHDYHGSAAIYAPPLAGLADDGVVAKGSDSLWLACELDGARLAHLRGEQAARHVAVIDLERPRVVVEESLM